MTILRSTEPQGTFRVTFEVFTDESVADGDAAQRGWLDSSGCPVDEYHESVWTFRELLEHLGGHRPEGDGDRVPCWVTVDPGSDFWLSSFWRDLAGEDALGAQASVHRPDWITDASWLRVCRALGWRPL